MRHPQRKTPSHTQQVRPLSLQKVTRTGSEKTLKFIYKITGSKLIYDFEILKYFWKILEKTNPNNFGI